MTYLPNSVVVWGKRIACPRSVSPAGLDPENTIAEH